MKLNCERVSYIGESQRETLSCQFGKVILERFITFNEVCKVQAVLCEVVIFKK